MKLKPLSKLFVIVALALAVGIWLTGQPGPVDAQGPTDEISTQAALGTVFTFQGHLTNARLPVNGKYDFEFKLYDDDGSGNPPKGAQVGGTVTPNDVEVTNGSFAVELDFGDVFQGQARWLQIGVRPGDSKPDDPYRLLSPRVRLTLTPYALSLRPGATIVNTDGPGLHVKTTSYESTGVIGEASSTTAGVGVLGLEDGTGYGVLGRSEAGTGVFGYGVTGVHGISTHSGGYGGYFKNVNGGGALGIEGGPGALITAFGQKGVGSGFSVDNEGRAFFGVTTRQMLNLWDGDFGIGVQHDTLYYRSNNGFAWYKGGVHNDAQNDPGGGAALMTLDGNGRLAVKSLQITGADLSERFDIRSDPADLPPSPGIVACIDPEHPGKLVICSQAYDQTVVGVVSGAGGINTGMLMSQPGSVADGQYPVALTGRVYVWADASSGPIQPGDLLTTSATPGHAMKVANYDQAHGAILGKAMSGLEKGKGLVLVLVSLQ